jgi:pimeloyl-ACP methyl ester carboxylesterase
MPSSQPGFAPAHETVTTGDGWDISLYRYAPAGEARPHPVLLVHGIASNHHFWDLGPGTSFAAHLRDEGFDVWSIDLRGRDGRRGPWCIDDFVLHDLPAALARISDANGGRSVHWVGHSLGGILGMLYQMHHGASELRSLVSIGAGLHDAVRSSVFRHVVRAFRLLRGVDALPLTAFAPVLALWARHDLPGLRYVWHAENMEPHVVRAVLERATSLIARGEVAQLGGALGAHGFCSRDGMLNYSFAGRHCTAPVLAIAGDVDYVCPVEGVAWTFESLGAQRKRLVVAGAPSGHATSYGHIDLVCGTRAPLDIWPEVVRWLDLHDGVDCDDAPLALIDDDEGERSAA